MVFHFTAIVFSAASSKRDLYNKPKNIPIEYLIVEMNNDVYSHKISSHKRKYQFYFSPNSDRFTAVSV
jgi:hypothetical protein